VGRGWSDSGSIARALDDPRNGRLSIAAIWIWHGLVPKLIYRHADEQAMLAQAGVALELLPWIGGIEILVGIFVLLAWRWRSVFVANIALMVIALLGVAINSPHYIQAAFNPVTLNLAVIALSIVGWIAGRNLPSSRMCLRSAPREDA